MINFEDIDLSKVVEVRKRKDDDLWHVVYPKKYENFGNYEPYDHYDRVTEDVALKVIKKL
jgi:hypothetical protein